MLDHFFSFLKHLPGSSRNNDMFSKDDPRLAAAALLIHVMGADGERDVHEQKTLISVLEREYAIKGNELEALVDAAEKAEAGAVDLYTFTSVLNRSLNEDDRAEFIRLLWEIVFADGHMHELEENLVWRIAELLGVDTRVRVNMRQHVLKGRTEG